MEGNFNGFQEPYYHNGYHHPHYTGGYNYDYRNDVNGNQFNPQYQQHQQHQPHHQQQQQPLPPIYHQHHNYQPHDQFYGQQNTKGERNAAFSGTVSGYSGGGKKRGFHSGPGVSPDPTDGSGKLPKLYVAPVPKTATEDEIRSVFGDYGNVHEIILPKDKRTGDRGGYCFVKYKTLEESDRAISSLQNKYTFPGEMAAVKVRYADVERDRNVPRPDKLYVGGLSRQATKTEINEIFSAYGHVEDIYIVRDDKKQSRGCAFVQFSRRDMAFTAMKALHGVFTMRGCDQPLTVKLADPKKPRLGETRPNHTFGGAVSRPILQEAAVRPPPNTSFSMRQSATISCTQTSFPQTSQETVASAVIQHVDPSSQKPQYQREFSQLSHHEGSEAQKGTHLVDASTPFNEPQLNPEIANVEVRLDAGEVDGAASATTRNQQELSSLECDWSEHTCPDGHKYYYNCVTCESTWEKPEEFCNFEKQLQELHDSLRNSQSAPTGCSNQLAAQSRESEVHDQFLQMKLGVL